MVNIVRRPVRRFAVCLRNRGYEVSLERLKIYQVLGDREAARYKQIRVIDESGENYLYPRRFFARIRLSAKIRRALRA